MCQKSKMDYLFIHFSQTYLIQGIFLQGFLVKIYKEEGDISIVFHLFNLNRVKIH